MGSSLTGARALLFALTLSVVAERCGGSTAKAARVEPGVAAVQPSGAVSAPESSSLVIAASRILLLRVATATAGNWEPADEGMRRRQVQTDFVLERALKGDVGEPSGSHVSLTVNQFESVGRVVAVPGHWSGKGLNRDAEFVVFSRAATSHVAEALAESSVLRVIPAAEVLPDLDLALAAEAQQQPVGALINRARERVASLGPLFADYLNARLPEVLFADPASFDGIMGLVEDPRCPTSFKQVLLRNVFAKLVATGSAPQHFTSRLAITGFRLIGSDAPAPIPGQLIGTYLPNLLGFVGQARQQSANDVFREFPNDRASAERALSRHANTPGADRLLAWLRS
jgi:hypothetical protein